MLNGWAVIGLRHPQPPRGGFGPFGPEMSPRVSDRVSPNIRVSEVWTLWGPGPKEPSRHSSGHSLGHPDFRGHSLGHSEGHFRPEGPEASCRGLGMSQASAGPSIEHAPFSTVMAEVVNMAITNITSEVQTSQYVDGTVLLGPTAEAAKEPQQLLALIQPIGLQIQLAKTQ